MKVFIVADIEGVAGVTRPTQCQQGNTEYEGARGLMEGEVNAAIEGALLAGATRIVVADSHGTMGNLRADNIHPAAELVQGKPREFSMAQGIETDHFDAVAFIGLHSPASVKGVLAHTINGRAFHRVELNGKVVGESDLYAAFAAEHGTPLVLTSGDDCFSQWVSERHPGVEAVCVKTMHSTVSAQSLSPQTARKLLREAMGKTLSRPLPSVTPHFTAPFSIRLTTTRPVLADGFAMLPGIIQEEAQVVSFTCDDMGGVIRTLGALSLYSGSLL